MSIEPEREKSKSRESASYLSTTPRGSSLEVSTKNSEGGMDETDITASHINRGKSQSQSQNFNIDPNDQKIIRKKERQSVDEFMSQFPKTSPTSKELYNLIYNCVNEEEKNGDKGLKNEFYKKEIEDIKKQKEEEKRVSRMIHDRLVKGKADMDEKVSSSKNPSIINNNNINNNNINYNNKNKEKDKMMSEKELEKFMYGHPTINGKTNVYMGKKVRRKKNEKYVEEDSYDLRSTHNVLSLILQKQMEKDRKKLEKISLRKHYTFFEEKKKPSIFAPEHEKKFKEKALEYQRIHDVKRVEPKKSERRERNENSINYSIKDTTLKRKVDSRERRRAENNLENIMDKIDKLDENYIKREKPREDAIDKEIQNKKEWDIITQDNNIDSTNNNNLNNSNNNSDNNFLIKDDKDDKDNDINTTEIINTDSNLNTTISTLVKNLSVDKNNLNNNNNIINTQEQNELDKNNEYTNMIDSQNAENDNSKNNISDFVLSANNSLLQKKRYNALSPLKRRRRYFFDYLGRSYYSSKDSENNDMNFLEILFKEYGYNNIIYILTDSPEIKLGENKIRKIKNSISDLLGYEKNLPKIVETVINMRKSHLVDESWIKGKYNYRTRNRNNINLNTYHYRLHSDGYIYKFKVDKFLRDGSIKFRCCEDKCHARGVLYPRIRKFKIIEKHNIAALQHEYMKLGYDKFQFKMEYKNWKEIQLKDNRDENKSYIDWHKAVNGDNN